MCMLVNVLQRYIDTLATQLDDALPYSLVATNHDSDHMKCVVTNTPVLIWTTDDQMMGTSFNDAWLEFIGRVRVCVFDGWDVLL